MTHPTRRLYEASVERIDRLHNSGRLLPWTTLAPKAALPLSVYLPACVIPRLLHEPSIAGRLPPATLTALRPVPCPSWRQGVEYWDPAHERRIAGRPARPAKAPTLPRRRHVTHATSSATRPRSAPHPL